MTAPIKARQKARELEEGVKRDEQRERAMVQTAAGLNAPQVYGVIQSDGEEELSRPNSALFWSGIAAGICISFSVLGEALLRAHLPDAPWRHLVENLGYSLGFLIVILGRMQLFTENTITTVLPLLHHRQASVAVSVARLWSVVLGANVIGAFMAAAFIVYTPVFGPDMHAAILALSQHATAAPPLTALAKGVPAGLLVAALVWMLASRDGEPFWIILIFTWLIAAGDFSHIVAGTVEMAYLLLTDHLQAGPAFLGFFLPVLVGNIIGGTVVFALMVWGQVRKELDE